MNNLNTRRKELSFTQAKMAVQLGIGVSTYCMYENGQRHVPKKIAYKIAEILDVAVEELFEPSLFKTLCPSLDKKIQP